MSEKKQTLIKLSWPSGVICHPADFREELAKDESLPQAFFHYTNEVESWNKKKEYKDGVLLSNEESGRERVIRQLDKAIPANGRAPVRIVGSKSWSGIVSDPGAEDLIMPYIATYLKVATKIAKSPVKIEIEQHNFGIQYTQSPVRYLIREMAVKRRNEKSRAEDINALVADRIWGGVNGNDCYGIDGTVAQFGFEPADRESLEINVFTERNIGLHLKTADGNSNEYVSLINGEVFMNAQLEGYWQVGNLIARGYGRLIKAVGAQ